jgi:hypothetical protein
MWQASRLPFVENLYLSPETTGTWYADNGRRGFVDAKSAFSSKINYSTRGPGIPTGEMVPYVTATGAYLTGQNDELNGLCPRGMKIVSFKDCVGKLSEPIYSTFAFDGRRDSIDITQQINSALRAGKREVIFWLAVEEHGFRKQVAYVWGNTGQLRPFVELELNSGQPKTIETQQKSSGTPSTLGCAKDTDCKGDRICVDRECRNPE